MTSRELKIQKEEFIKNIDAFIEKYNNLHVPLNNINDVLINTEDTMLNNEILEQSVKISDVVKKTVNKLENKKRETVNKLNNEISILEKQEQEALEDKGGTN